jgi:hypothetical protein
MLISHNLANCSMIMIGTITKEEEEIVILEKIKISLK